MFICQYDINSDNFDLEILMQAMKTLEEKLPNETIIAIPSGLTISEWSDEDGLQELERIYRFLGENIERLRDTIGKNDESINDAIRYMDICSVSPYYHNAWEIIKKGYDIKRS